MKLYFHLYLISSLLLFISCQKNDEYPKWSSFSQSYIDKLLQVANNETKRVINAKKLSDLFKITSIINLETAENCIIGSIENIIVVPEEEKIIIQHRTNRYEILVFDYKGKFLNRIGSHGQGPGEYIDPNPITYGNNKLVIYSQDRKLLFYNLKGTLLDEISFIAKEWYFSTEEMVVCKNDLYIYTNNDYFNLSPEGKRDRVFRLNNFNEYSLSFGDTEETFGWDGGSITTYNNKIIFTGVFDGNIYQFLPDQDKCLPFTAFGSFFDINEIRKSKNATEYLIKNVGELNSFLQLGTINNLLYVKTMKGLSVVDSTGGIININLENDLPLPPGYKDNALRLQFLFFNKGFICASTQESNITSTFTPNPSLIFYEFKY